MLLHKLIFKQLASKLFRYGVCKNPPLVSFVCQIKLVETLTCYFLQDIFIWPSLIQLVLHRVLEL